MRDKFSCFSDTAVSFSTPSSSTSVQTAVTCVYTTRLSSTQSQMLITLSWFRSLQSGLSITLSHVSDSESFNLTSNSRLFKKKRGSKKIEFARSRVEILWNFTNARYDRSPEPVGGFYVVILVDSDLRLLLGDNNKFRIFAQSPPNSALLLRREHFSGNSSYKTKSRFGNSDIEHDIEIKISSEADEVRSPLLSVYIDKKKVVRVTSLQWNFRGSQTIFLEGTQFTVDMFWDVHDWFFTPSSNGCGIFMFSGSSGLMDDKLFSEEENSKPEPQFSLFIYATKSSS